MFPLPCPSRDKVSDHAISRLHSARIHLGLVPIPPLRADRTYRSAPSSGSLQTEHFSPEASAHRSLTLGVALAPVAALAKGPGIRATPDSDRLAEEAIPQLLATAQSERQAGPAGHRARGLQADPRYVAIKSDLGLASHCRGAAEAWHRCRQIDGGEVSAKGP